MVEGDPVRLAQVFANLLNNAAKYTDPGGRIWISIGRHGNWAAVSVRDTGAGIAGEMLPRVFELFTQAEHLSERSQGGLGIGLTLVRSLVEMHGGNVEAFSEGPGRGSEFIVRLPLAAVHVVEAPRTRSREVPAPSLQARRVMVVDDNHDAAESMGILLKLLGADVQVVYSGTEALDLIPTYQPSAVLLDIGMPGMDGHEVARRIRQLPEFRDITLIALSGWGQEEDRRRSKQAGFDYHLIKPADVNALQNLLGVMEKS